MCGLPGKPRLWRDFSKKKLTRPIFVLFNFYSYYYFYIPMKYCTHTVVSILHIQWQRVESTEHVTHSAKSLALQASVVPLFFTIIMPSVNAHYRYSHLLIIPQKEEAMNYFSESHLVLRKLILPCGFHVSACLVILSFGFLRE